MSREQDNKAIVARWFEGFWGNPWNPEIIDELAGSLGLSPWGGDQAVTIKTAENSLDRLPTMTMVRQ